MNYENMDFDAYYREQDKRMNIPDEDIEDYLKRIGARRAPSGMAASRRVQHGYSTQHDISRDPTASMLSSTSSVSSPVREDATKMQEQASSSVLPAEQSNASPSTANNHESSGLEDSSCLNPATTVEQSRSPAGRKRKAPSMDEQQSTLPGSRPVSPNKRRKSIELASSSPLDASSPSSDILEIRGPYPADEDISHFTEDATPDKRGASPTSSSRTSNRRLKRQAPENTESPANRKKRAISLSIEDFTLLDANPTTHEKATLPQAKPQTRRRDKQVPPLNFKPVVPTVASSSSNEAPTSAVEDCTLDKIKQRVAQYAAEKNKNRIVKRSSEIPNADDLNRNPGVSSSKQPRTSLALKSEAVDKTPQLDSKDPKTKTKTKTVRGKKKEKAVQLTPLEYAEKICSEANEKIATASEQDLQKPSKYPKFLSGLKIFYTGGDMLYASERTRGRMDLIVRYGGTLVPRYDASVVTHIITDAHIGPTLRALGIKRSSEIPNHIPTITWTWVASALGRVLSMGRGSDVRMEELFMHAAFSDRLNAGPDSLAVPKQSGKGKAKAKDPENVEVGLSGIIDLTEDHPNSGSGQERIDVTEEASTSAVNLNASKSTTNDPLAQFYAKARADHETKWPWDGEAKDSETDLSEFEVEEPPPVVIAPTKRGWTCDNKAVQQRNPCPNQDVIDKLEELKKLHEAKLGDDDRWRVYNYNKAIRGLRHHPKRITSFAEAQNIRGVGEKTAQKIMEIVKTGGLRRIGYENTEGVQITKVFQGVYGVGPPTAYQWYAAGCRGLTDVLAGKGGITLTPAQKIGIQFYDDINDRMPREEAREIFELIKTIALSIDPRLFIEIMGSYRRGKADCGDIDILITRPPDDGITHKGVLSRLLAESHAAGILTEDLACPDDPDELEAVYRGLCRIPGRDGARRRRIDFLTVPWKYKGAALLYYTGDDIFNRAMRMKARVLGYSLNQRGLFHGVVRDPKDGRKLNTGTIVASETEEEIFKILSVPWQEPHERVRG